MDIYDLTITPKEGEELEKVLDQMIAYIEFTRQNYDSHINNVSLIFNKVNLNFKHGIIDKQKAITEYKENYYVYHQPITVAEES